MTTKRPRPFFPEGCPQAGPGEAGWRFSPAHVYGSPGPCQRVPHDTPRPRSPPANGDGDRRFQKVVPQVSGTKLAANLPLEDVMK